MRILGERFTEGDPDTPTHVLAKEALGINEFWADMLFRGDNTIDDLRAIVSILTSPDTEGHLDRLQRMFLQDR